MPTMRPPHPPRRRLIPALLTAAAVALTTAGLIVTAPAAAQTTTVPLPTPATREQLALGEQLYTQSCTSCHGPEGEGMELSGGVQAPSLVGVGPAAVDFYLSTGRMPLADTNVPQAVRKPPAFDADQRAAIVAYVVSFGPGGPAIPQVDPAAADLTRGLQLYLLNCAACHNASGIGGALSYGSFAPNLHQATATEIAEAQRIGPGNMPVFGPDTLTDHQVNDIVAYVLYLRHPEDAGGAGLARAGPTTEGFVGLMFGLGPMLLFVAWVGTRA
jgi:ubiquinol-cytochrome c reductase cytochrome c subunit